MSRELALAAFAASTGAHVVSAPRSAPEGRWGAFGQFWGQNPALPESPLWFLASSLVVFAGGIALIVLTY